MSSEQDDDEEEEETRDQGDSEEQEIPPGGRNSQLVVGYKGDRSYVVRGNNIGVFRHAGDNQVKYYATIKKVATPKGKEFQPEHVCLSWFSLLTHPA
jgi:hypothetical protein